MPRGHPRITQSVYYDGPAIPLDKDDIALRKDAKLGSSILREACLDLFQRTANRYQVSMSDAMACHLGYHAPAKIVRSPASLYHGRIAA